ncbi:hypothetical protein BGX26_004080 [Mortierella sp. AD094]|nr:hypothetical protein BGX26_004080 [Mortierella sp. AD094]
MERVYNPVFAEKEKSWTVRIETGVLIKDLDDVLRNHDPHWHCHQTPCLTLLSMVVFSVLVAAATHNCTLSDLVCKVSIIYASGKLNTLSDNENKEEFSAASTNLGLLDVVYSNSLRVEPLFKLVMRDTPELCGPKLEAMVLNNDQTEIFHWRLNTLDLGAANDRIWVKQ